VINAGQAGVAVSINKREYGLTNAKGELTVPLLEAGNYFLEVQKPGFQALTQQVRIEPQKQTQLAVQLVRPVIAGSSATIEGAPPGAEVRLDGELLGTTAADGSFLLTPIPGKHTVQVAKEGFLPLQTKEMFAPGKSVTRRAALEPDTEFQRWQTLSNNATLPEIDRFIRDYPSGRFTAQARTLQEQTQWNAVKNGKDLEALTAFVNRFPQGPHVSEARNVMQDLQTEQEIWLSARASKDVAQLKAYLEKYSQGQYAPATREEIANLSDVRAAATSRDAADKTAVLEVIKQYRQAYDERNVEELRKIWPSMDKSRVSSLRDFFRTASVKSTVHIDQEPLINGDEATVKFTQLVTYVMEGGESKPFALTSTAKLKRVASTTQGVPGGWRIDSLSAN
jgi:PEGA domain